MKLRLVLIEEAIHIDNPLACRLWQKTLWIKEKGYRQHYKTSVMPVQTDDFFATHYIVAEEMQNGELEPVAMLKSVTQSICRRFNTSFGGLSLLNGTGFEQRKEILDILNGPADISYESSWTINPSYQKDKDLSKKLRDYMTLYACIGLRSRGIPRWLTAGVTQFKIDQYFSWLGGEQVLPSFSLPIIDNQTVRLMYIADTANPPVEPMRVALDLRQDWENRIVFKPAITTLSETKHELQSA